MAQEPAPASEGVDADPSGDLRRRASVSNMELARAERLRKIIVHLSVSVLLAGVIVTTAWAYLPPRYFPPLVRGELVVLVTAALLADIFLVRYAMKATRPLHLLRIENDSLWERYDTWALKPKPASRDDKVREYFDGVQRESREMREKAKRDLQIHNWLQSLVIVGSLVTSSVASLSVYFEWLRWATVLSSFLVGVAAGFTSYFKFRQRSLNREQTADALLAEYTAADLRIGKYRRITDDDAVHDFIVATRQILAEERSRAQSLDQTPEAEEDGPTQGQSAGRRSGKGYDSRRTFEDSKD